MKVIFIFLIVILTSCSPVQESEYETKYPEIPTMQSAEDANTGQLFKD